MDSLTDTGPGTVYLLHFSAPYRHAQHYLGWTPDLTARLQQHRKGQGARLLQVVAAAGIAFDVVRTWTGGRKLERKLKNQKHARRLCPLCSKKTEH